MKNLVWIAVFIIIVISVLIGSVIGGVVGYTLAVNRAGNAPVLNTSQGSAASLPAVAPAAVVDTQPVIIDDKTAAVEAVTKALPAVVTIEVASGFGGGR